MTPSLFSRMHPYYLVAPDYTATSAGVRVMHTLTHMLNSLGAEAYVTGCRVVSTALRTPLLTQDLANYHRAAGLNPIAVYPEVVSGNPLRAKTIVRYLLNRPGHLGGDDHYPASDLLYTYDPYFLPEGWVAKVLTLPVSDPDIMHPPTDPAAPREHFGFYARKYRHFGHPIDPAHASGVDLSHPERSPVAISDLLRTLTHLYCYEPSNITIDAILCGCPVVYILSSYMSTRPAKPFFGHYGVCETLLKKEPTERELSRARGSLIYCPYQYQRMIAAAWKAVNDFISYTQEYAQIPNTTN